MVIYGPFFGWLGFPVEVSVITDIYKRYVYVCRAIWNEFLVQDAVSCPSGIVFVQWLAVSWSSAIDGEPQQLM